MVFPTQVPPICGGRKSPLKASNKLYADSVLQIEVFAPGTPVYPPTLTVTIAVSMHPELVVTV